MSLPIAQLGQPVLREKAAEIPLDEIQSPKVQDLVEQMLVTVTEAKGAGLAGPQVFQSKRLFVAGVLPPKAEDNAPEMEVFINPIVTPTSQEAKLGWEGCLSFPELLVLVPRHQAVQVRYLNREGKEQTLDQEGFPARVVQHEFDHLHGILSLDRAPNTRCIIKGSELEAARKEFERDS